jgi:hypothetical protein
MKHCKQCNQNKVINKSLYCSDKCVLEKNIEHIDNCWIWKVSIKNQAGKFISADKKWRSKPNFASMRIYKNIKLGTNNIVKNINNCHNGCINPDHLEIGIRSRAIIPTNCKLCNIELNNSTKAFDKGYTFGFLHICKTCNNKNERKKRNLIDNKCLQCNQLIKNNTNKFCSLEKCKIPYYSQKKDDCIIWTNHNYGGYPGTYWNNKKIAIRTYIYLLHHKKIPEKNLIFNSCNNPSCISIKHLYADQPWKKAMEKVKKFTNDQIKDIKYKKFELKWPTIDIANHYNCYPKTIHDIINDKRKSYFNENIKNIGFCINCQNKHDNTESEFCSPSCMQEFLLK